MIRAQNKRPLPLEDLLSFDRPGDDDDTFVNAKRQKREIDNEWNVQKLPSMPLYYAREKTSVVIVNDEAKDIAKRIVDQAQLISAFGYYNDLKAKATLSTGQMELYIQLFQQTPTAIIVEIRRKNGSSFNFHKTARSLLAAAKGDNDTSDLPAVKKRPINMQTTPMIEKVDTIITCTMETIDALLKKDRLDANLLGMQSLLYTSDPSTSSPSVTLFTANTLLDNDESAYSISDKVFSLITNSMDLKDEEGNTVGESYFQKMRLSALSVLNNSLSLLAKRGSLGSKIGGSEWVGKGGILESLMGDMKNADSSPQEAYLAAKCLTLLIESSTSFRSKAMDSNLIEAVPDGQRKGCSGHHLLRNASDNLMKLIEK